MQLFNGDRRIVQWIVRRQQKMSEEGQVHRSVPSTAFKQVQIFWVSSRFRFFLFCIVVLFPFYAFFYVYVAQDIRSSILALDFYHSSCVLNPQGLFRVVNMEDPDRGPLENHLVFWWVKRHPIDYEDGPDDDNGLSVMMMVCQWWRWFVANEDDLS